MRKILLFCCGIAFAISMQAQGYFQDGMVWEMSVCGTQDPYPVWVSETVSLKGITEVDGVQALRMFYESENVEKRELTVVRTEGDKVYFKNNKNSSEWTLLYDFGLQTGEGCVVGAINMNWENDDKPITSYLKCVDIEEGRDAYAGFDVMILEEYRNEAMEDCIGEGKWLKGLGSPTGVTQNIRFDVEGGAATMLIEGILRGAKVFPKDTNGIDGVITSDGFITVCVSSGRMKMYDIDPSRSLSVYSADGRCVFYRAKPQTSESVKLEASGLYIVKNGSDVQKLVVN